MPHLCRRIYNQTLNLPTIRAHVEVGGGAWCPRTMVFDEGLDHLEVNLETNHVVTKVEVQGRFGNGQGREYAEKYKLQYWRASLGHWVTYRDGHGNEIFSQAKLYFSVGGKYYSKSVTYEAEPDHVFEKSRNVTILLKQIPAKKVKLMLYFAHMWIMLSEVTFDSDIVISSPVPCDCDLPVEDGPVPLDVDMRVFSPAVVPADDGSSGVLIGCLATLGVIFCLVLIVLAVLFYKKKISNKDKSTPPFVKNAKRKVALNMNDLHFNMTGRTGSVPRSMCRFYGDTNQDDESSAMYQEPYKGPVNNPGYYTLAQGSSLSDKALQPMLGARDSSDYAIPTMSTSHPPSLMDIYKIPPPVPVTMPPGSLMDMSSDPELKEAKKDLSGRFGVDIRGMVGSSLFAMPESVTLRSELPVLEIKRNDFKLLDLLGESTHGVVHLCALDQTAPQDGVDIEKNKCLHIIKTLKLIVSELNKEEFRNEIRILSNISDPNIAGLVGIVPCDPLSAIFEYSEYGDLYQFLRFHDYNNEVVSHNTLNSCLVENRPNLSYGALLYISSQIASGMKYLESHNLVHRDLSARNCLVGKKLRVKVSDFAVTRALYASDYWNIEGRLLLPIRWMPPESILHARFSTKSDVWSFGVTLWEILTYAAERPLDDLSDSAVVEHICRSCQTQDPIPLLPQPELTCKEVYQMMTSCWRSTERQRPPFWEILMFLQRKNLGYVLDYRE
ncbi:hypothetical protein HAZT_HAZT010086 [Hyalella azteca]|uniref:Protein kinase domain-containing protein n=1 Tax=Hyalella azteca TaxID=294128 RepID=A0A6A0H792_HYAAZ|nr:hypothetical protein HAZT_HAZT010086 [Hyalella azteca]